MGSAFLFCPRIARVVLALSVCVRSRERLCCRKNSSDTSKSTMRGRCGCEKATIDSLFVANRVFLVYKTPGHTNVPKLKTAVCRCLGELTCPESLICAFSLLICDNMSSIGLSTTRLAFARSVFLIALSDTFFWQNAILLNAYFFCWVGQMAMWHNWATNIIVDWKYDAYCLACP